MNLYLNSSPTLCSQLWPRTELSTIPPRRRHRSATYPWISLQPLYIRQVRYRSFWATSNPIIYCNLSALMGRHRFSKFHLVLIDICFSFLCISLLSLYSTKKKYTLHQHHQQLQPKTPTPSIGKQLTKPSYWLYSRWSASHLPTFSHAISAILSVLQCANGECDWKECR